MDVHLIAIEVSVERRTHALIKPKRISWRDLGSEAHHTDPMETWLPIEYHNVVVSQMPLDSITDLQIDFAVSHGSPAAVCSNYKVSTAKLGTIFYAGSEELD